MRLGGLVVLDRQRIDGSLAQVLDLLLAPDPGDLAADDGQEGQRRRGRPGRAPPSRARARPHRGRRSGSRPRARGPAAAGPDKADSRMPTQGARRFSSHRHDDAVGRLDGVEGLLRDLHGAGGDVRDRRGERREVGGSCETVPQQEFKRPVEADMGHLGHAARRIDRQLRRPEAREAEGARRHRALEHGLGASPAVRPERSPPPSPRRRSRRRPARPPPARPATARRVSRPSRMVVSRVARTEASATVPTRAPAASVRRAARFTRRRRIASSRSWSVWWM